jgi:hypothetical protein
MGEYMPSKYDIHIENSESYKFNVSFIADRGDEGDQIRLSFDYPDVFGPFKEGDFCSLKRTIVDKYDWIGLHKDNFESCEELFRSRWCINLEALKNHIRVLIRVPWVRGEVNILRKW